MHAGLQSGLVIKYLNEDPTAASCVIAGCSVLQRGKQVALEVALALHYLHSHSTIHFDLKSPNVLLTRYGTAKIADVGLVRTC